MAADLGDKTGKAGQVKNELKKLKWGLEGNNKKENPSVLMFFTFLNYHTKPINIIRFFVSWEIYFYSPRPDPRAAAVAGSN